MRKLLICLFALAAVMTGCSSDDNSDGRSGSGSGSLRQTVASIDSDYVYELPVVFHVLYSDESSATQYIPYQRLANILSYVNQIYQGNVYGESENIHVKFVLATEDENGNKLRYQGVDYVHYTGDYPIDVNKFMTDQTGANVKYIWEPNKYINVMMFNFKSDDSDNITLGISHMPYSVAGSSHQLEGLSTVKYEDLRKNNLPFAYCSAVNSLYANQQPTGGYYQSDRYTNTDHQATTFSAADIVVTLAHELGHYLGLLHDFTESRGSGSASVEPVDSCGDTDYCADTYSYNRAEYLEYTKGILAKASSTQKVYINELTPRRSCDGVSFESDNIMDYYYSYGFKITADQKKRIRNVLNYSPLIPGPKLSNGKGSTRAAAPSGSVDLPITIIK